MPTSMRDIRETEATASRTFTRWYLTAFAIAAVIGLAIGIIWVIAGRGREWRQARRSSLRSASGGGTPAVTFAERADAVVKLGFTERQGRFLATVALHSGVCMDRHYCAFAGIRHGQKTHDFFESLVDRRFATAYRCAHGRARIFHLHRRGLYEAIGEPESRFRRPTPIGRTIERLMLLDAVLAHRNMTWLATEREKMTHFTHLLHSRIDRDDLPHLTFGHGDTKTVRYFPDKLPIGVPSHGGVPVFTYLMNRSVPVDFRQFLHRHSGLFQALPRWTIRLLVPAHLDDAAGSYEAAWREEFGSPLRLSTANELSWYFEQRRQLEERAEEDKSFDRARYARARDAFAAPGIRVLYRTWLRQGPSVLRPLTSPVLADAMTRRTGQFETEVLPRPYLHLAPLVTTA